MIGLFSRFGPDSSYNVPGAALRSGLAAAQPIDSSALLRDHGAGPTGLQEDAQLVLMPMPHAPGHAPAPVPVGITAWAVSSSTPAILESKAADFIAWMIQQPGEQYGAAGMLPPSPQVGAVVYGKTAAPYYALIPRAQWVGDSSPIWSRFREHFWDFYGGMISTHQFARILDNEN